MKAGLLRGGSSCPEEKICGSRWNDSFTKIRKSLKISVLLIENGVWSPNQGCWVLDAQVG